MQMVHCSAFNMLTVLLHFPPLKSGVVESDGDPLPEFLKKRNCGGTNTHNH